MISGSDVTTDTEGVVIHSVNWGVVMTLLAIAVVVVLLIVRRVRRR